MERLRCCKINGSQFNILQYKVFLPIMILIFSVCGINGDVTLSVDPAMSRGRPSFITCTTTNQITAGVQFFKDSFFSQGSCLSPGGPCRSTVPGYNVTQNVSTRTTTLSIDSVNCTRETGSWYCKHGGDPPSPTVYIGCNTTKYSPSIDKSQFPSTYTVIAGRQLNINCASYTTPGRPSDTNYTWTHPDGSTTSGSTLNINSIDSNQSGQFTCTASNIFSSTQQGQDSATVQVQVQFPPRVSGQDSSYPVVESSPLHIDCSSFTTPGNPSTTSYRWTGPDSYTSTGSVLSISSISRTQTGQYTCTASNTLTPTGGPPQTGTGTGQFIVDVRYKPSISGFPDPYYVTENTNLQMDCSTYSQSNPAVTSYRWTGPGYSRDGAVLSISNINKDKTGQYTCTASNDIGRGTGQTTVNVQYKPSISGFPDPYYVTENTNLQLDCSTYSQSNPAVTSYRWTGPGYSRDGAVLSISNISKDKTGQYTCTASNILTPSGGSPVTVTGSSTLRVQVQYKPRVHLPARLNVTESTPLYINCSEHTTPGEPSSTSFSWSGPGGYSSTGPILSVTNIHRDRTGDYTCRAVNTLTPTGGSPQTESDTGVILVNVQYGPGASIATAPGPSLERLEGSGPLTVTCSADCNPVCSFKWRTGNTETQSHQLYISNVTRTDQGTHTCEAWNGIGNRKQKIFNLIIYYLDVPVLDLNKAEVMENDSVEISCGVKSNPTVQMIIENVDNRTELVNKMTNQEVYSISQARCLHNGSYVCTADNKKTGTRLHASKNLNVLCSPRPDFRVQLNKTIFMQLNKTASLTASFIANPVPRFSWYRYENSKLSPIDNKTVHKVVSVELKTTLQINITHTRDYSNYVVVANNLYGNDRLVYTLATTGPPLRPTDLAVTVLGDTFIGLQWVSNYNSGAYQTFHLSYRTEESEDWVLSAEIDDPGQGQTVRSNITGLSSETFYIIQLYSTNIYGKSDSIVSNSTTLAGRLDTTGPSTGSGTGLGIGFGVCIPIIIIITLSLIIFHKRREELLKEEIKKWQDSATVNPNSESITDRAVYSTLDQDKPAPVYEKINLGETTAHQYANVNREGSVHLYVN